jgi:hypothetical protein
MDIIKIIQETATWIESVNKDYETNLYRTAELLPDRHLIYGGNEQQITKVVERRSELLKATGVSLIAVEDLQLYGRIMIFDVDSTVVDGASEGESSLYVDLYDTPPVDTWIALGSRLTNIGMVANEDEYFNQSLLAWVPASQYFYANEASLVSLVDNIVWPDPTQLTPAFEFLNLIFSSPENIVKPKDTINLQQRIVLMKRYTEKLDEVGKYVDYYTPQLESILTKLRRFLSEKIFGIFQK